MVSISWWAESIHITHWRKSSKYGASAVWPVMGSRVKENRWVASSNRTWWTVSACRRLTNGQRSKCKLSFLPTLFHYPDQPSERNHYHKRVKAGLHVRRKHKHKHKHKHRPRLNRDDASTSARKSRRSAFLFLALPSSRFTRGLCLCSCLRRTCKPDLRSTRAHGSFTSFCFTLPN